MVDQTFVVLTGLAGLLCVLAAGLFAFVGYVWVQRGNDRGAASTATPAPVSAAPPPPPVRPPANLPDDGYTEDDMPTVVVSTPELAARAASLRKELGAEPQPSPAASRRSAGATIIAFDDDEDDDE